MLKSLSTRRGSLDDLINTIFIRFRPIVLIQLILLYIGINVSILAKRGLCIISWLVLYMIHQEVLVYSPNGLYLDPHLEQKGTSVALYGYI